MTGTDTELVGFINSRLEDLEQMAHQLGGAELEVRTKGGWQMQPVVSQFLATNNPHWMLARVAAGRELVSWATDETIEVSAESGFAEWYQVPLKCLAAEFRHHPGYKTRWRVQ